MISYLDVACLAASIVCTTINVILLRRSDRVIQALNNIGGDKETSTTDVHVDLHNRLMQLQGSSYARAYMNTKDRTQR